MFRPQALMVKVSLYLTTALSAAMVVFTALIGLYQRDALLDQAADHVTQLSEVITRSTRFAMLQNQPAYVERIIRDVADQRGLDRVRILSMDGKITHSSYPPEVGRTVDRNTEACVNCHTDGKPLQQVPRGKRTWTFAAEDGARMLGAMEVIRNEPSCYNAACHQHPRSTSVLGVLDIVYSLAEIDQTVDTRTGAVAGFSIGFILLASLVVAFVIHRLVYMPLRDLEAGAERISAGDLEGEIPVRHTDEFGRLATAFNAMTAALRRSQSELREGARTLEQKVEERTQELRRAQADTVRGEKLASVGMLAAGIAHEINNPLTGILTFSHLLRQKMPDGSPDAEDMDLVIRETRRCGAIIRRLLDFARDKAPEKKFADLNQIIEDTVHIVERPAHLRDIEIALELDRTLPPVWVDADLIKQVVMNMLVNAQHAIDDKGSITVRTRKSPEPKSPEPGAPAVPMVEFSIIDTGCGIPEHHLPLIFDPFFTTKEVGKGTGLGLSVSHGIVASHGGLIEVQSRVAAGTTFTVYLPLAAPSRDAGQTGGGSSR